MAKALPKKPTAAAGWWDRWWPHVLDFFLTLWVLRAPVATLGIGMLLMWLVPQAQDLLVELAMPETIQDWGRILLFFALLLLVWAMPTHYAARLLLISDERYIERVAARNTDFIRGLQEWTPRVLGALTFVVMLGGVYRAWVNLPPFADTAQTAAIGRNLLIVGAGLIAIGAVFLIYTIKRNGLAATATIRAVEAVLDGLLAPLRRWVPRFGAGPGTDSHLGPVLLLLMFIGFVGLPIACTLWFAENLPRAMSVPFVLGGWLPLTAYLSGLGRRLHAPIIFAGIMVVALLPLLFGDNYAIRRIPLVKDKAATSADSVTGFFDLKDAIAWWRSANCKGSACPRPIIIAAAGGASRAGFFTASTIGQLLDGQLMLEGKGPGLTPEAMKNRIFALSTVSGSSVGAVMTVAAMAASDKGVQPCTRDKAPLWDGDKINSWRSCLEALTSGDFVTPIFTGFVFRDIFGFFKWQDRGTLLERSVEDHFARFVAAKNPGGLACAGSLECGFTTLRPTKNRWLPVLMLNSTSVKTGQRVITSPLAWAINLTDDGKCPNSIRELGCEIFLRGANYYDWQGTKINSVNELRLSTAAHNSARFPLLSPPGSIVDADGRIVDRLVDGGYFENFGAQSATELANAIKVLDPSLNPFILVLSNDSQLVPTKAGVPPKNPDSGSVFLTDLAAPLGAFIETRNARGTLAVDGAAVALDHHNGGQCNTAWLRVWSRPDEKGTPQQLSMSWWLSKPVQRYLREQTEFADGQPKNGHRNAVRIRYLLEAIGDAKLPPVKPGEVQCAQDEE
jgi:hypothetical protein